MSDLTPDDLDEQSRIRFEKLAKLRERGYPFPNDTAVNATTQDVKRLVESENAIPEDSRSRITIAGRIMAFRLMGKAAFCSIQDRAGRIQIYVKKDEIGEDEFSEFKSFDLGDIVETSGYPFTTKTGEPSLHVTGIRLLTKCLHPLPEKWHGLTDVEVRYRQRYLDLIVNPDVQRTFQMRAKIISTIRKFLDERDYLEVETPAMTAIASGATARPFLTHHNTLDMKLNMRIALELPLKRLVVGGIERVYEIGRVFRNEGISTEHNPEFTMIEFYQAYATYEDLMELTEELFLRLCDDVVGSRKVEFKGMTIDFEKPWARYTMLEAIHIIGEVSRDFDLNTLSGVHAAASSLGFDDVCDITDYGLGLYEIFDRHVESKIINPTFITQHPFSISPLSRPNLTDPRFTDRFELMIAGMELANAFSELNDPEDQRARFETQARAKAAGDHEAMGMDEDYVRSLEYGLPPTAGEGIGIDRLTMLLTGQASIRDVILFPLMRPEDVKPEEGEDSE